MKTKYANNLQITNEADKIYKLAFEINPFYW